LNLSNFDILDAELRNSQILCYLGRWCRMWNLFLATYCRFQTMTVWICRIFNF